MEKKHVIIASVILLLFAGVIWALFSGEDAKVAEAKQLREELFKNAEGMSDDERRAQFDALREKTRDFSDAQRREFGQSMQQMMMQRVDRLLTMSPEEQRAELDQWIDRMEERRNNPNARGGPGGPGGDRGDRGNMSTADRDQRRKQMLARTTPEMRARMDAMRDLLNKRREERGLEPVEGGRGMFPGRPG